MKPRIILHIGQPKTGSTTLQKSLEESRPALEDAGILYPKTGRHSNHRGLIPYLANEESAFRNIDSMENSHKLWHEIISDIDDVRPKYIIISTEQLYRQSAADASDNIISNLEEVCSQLAISCYVREPASSALSRFQQAVKHRPNFTVRSNNFHRDTLEPYLKRCPDSLSVRIFDRNLLKGGDIVEDFFTAHLPDFDHKKISRCNANVSMSAEAMSLMQEINRNERSLPATRNASGTTSSKPLPSWKALKTIVHTDQKIDGFTRPRLHDHIRQAVQARCTDLNWLEETFGIVFPNFDPGSMSVDEANRLCDNLDRIADACPVNTERKEMLWSAACKNHSPMQRLLRRIMKKKSLD